MNVAGGLRVNEPAADLAVAAALISSLADKPLPPRTALFGEVSLSGAVRPVTQAAMRMNESAKLGFETVMTAPLAETKSRDQKNQPLNVKPIDRLADLMAALGAAQN